MDSLFHGSPLLQMSDESLRDPDDVVLNVASELNMEDTLFVRTPLSCSDVSIHSETSKYTDSSQGIVRTPEEHQIKDEHLRVSQICPSGVLLCWILATFAAIVVIVLSSDYGRHLNSESTLHDAVVEATRKEEILLNKGNDEASHVHSSSVHSFLKRSTTIKTTRTEKIGTVDVENTSSTVKYMAEERDSYVDSSAEMVPLTETDFLEEDEEFAFEEFYLDELLSPQILDESPPPLDSPNLQTHASAATVTSNNEVAVDTSIPLSMEEDLDFSDDTFPSFSSEENWISRYEETVEEAEASLASDEVSQEQFLNNTDEPSRHAIQPNWWTESSPQVHEEGVKSANTTHEDLMFEHDTLQLIDELEMETEVPGISKEYAVYAYSVPFEVVDSRSNASRVLVTKALQIEETSRTTKASSTLNRRKKGHNNRIAIVGILCAAFILLVALYIRRKALHSSVNRASLDGFSHDSSQVQTTTPSVQSRSWSTTLEAQDMNDTSPVEAEPKRVSSRNAKRFHALQGHLTQRFEFLNRKTHKRKIQPTPHTPATFHLDSLPPELWAIRLQPSETTL